VTRVRNLPRLPFPDISAAHQDVRDALEGLPFDLAVVRMFAHAEGGFAAWLRFGAAVALQGSLSPALRELAICVVTVADSPEYEYAYHRQALLAHGVTGDQVAAIERGEFRSILLSGRQQAVAIFAREVRDNVRASDEALAELRQHVSDRQVVELLLCIGLYMLNSRVAETTGVTLADDRAFAKPGQPTPEPPKIQGAA
jgi:alkylhydroperoxidase family enzyme